MVRQLFSRLGTCPFPWFLCVSYHNYARTFVLAFASRHPQGRGDDLARPTCQLYEATGCDGQSDICEPDFIRSWLYPRRYSRDTTSHICITSCVHMWFHLRRGAAGVDREYERGKGRIAQREGGDCQCELVCTWRHGKTKQKDG